MGVRAETARNLSHGLKRWRTELAFANRQQGGLEAVEGVVKGGAGGSGVLQLAAFAEELELVSGVVGVLSAEVADGTFDGVGEGPELGRILRVERSAKLGLPGSTP